MKQYRILLPLQNKLFNTTELTFSINYLRSRRPSVIYFMLHLFNIDGKEIYLNDNQIVVVEDERDRNDNTVAFISDRCVVGTAYSLDGNDFVYTFDVDKRLVDEAVYSQLEIITLGVDSENPLYFSELMFEIGHDHEDYHEPSELQPSHLVGLPTNTYANLYDNEDNYLQVIRPNKDGFHTDKLDKCECTILAPHFIDEDEHDDHVAVFLECMNQTEQTIDVLR